MLRAAVHRSTGEAQLRSQWVHIGMSVKLAWKIGARPYRSSDGSSCGWSGGRRHQCTDTMAPQIIAAVASAFTALIRPAGAAATAQ